FWRRRIRSAAPGTTGWRGLNKPTTTEHLVKKALKIIAVFVFLVVVYYGAQRAYYANKYKQHLPTNDIVVNEVERQYHIYVPETVGEEPAEVLVLLQGGSAGSWRIAQQSRWEALADERGMILAVPTGMVFYDNEGAWQLNTDAETMQDIDYVTAMLDDVAAKHRVDAARTYAVGYSLGSMFSYELVCQMSDRFAAVASFAGTMPLEPKSCNPERFVPIMHVHGIDDRIIAYDITWDWKAWDSVGTMRDIPSLVQYWASKYGCQESSETASDTAAHLVHSACDQDARVEHYRLASGGHGWPENINGESTHQVMWSFLAQYSMP
ncbi:MAG: PHB depolymerase family esterase, partial [Pseudomonadota bacterium]